jgi:hypothetical protein
MIVSQFEEHGLVLNPKLGNPLPKRRVFFLIHLLVSQR